MTAISNREDATKEQRTLWWNFNRLLERYMPEDSRGRTLGACGEFGCFLLAGGWRWLLFVIVFGLGGDAFHFRELVDVYAFRPELR